MSHTLQRKLMTDTLTSPSDDKKLTIYSQLLRAGSYHLTKKLSSLMQRQITLIQSIVVLTIICITLLLLMNLARTSQISHVETNMEPAMHEQEISPKYTSVVPVVYEIIPRVIMPRIQMENIRREFDGRRQRVTRVCETTSSKKSHLNATLMNMIIDMEHNVSWCPVYKAASSTWMNFFATLKGALTDITMNLVRRNLVQIVDIVRQKFRHDNYMDLNETYEKVVKTKKFLIVRHPLERLLSAYRDKLEHVQGREYYYKRFGRRIVLKYRQFHNEIKLEPTFEEFLRFIVNEKYFDEHWAPYYRTCEPCLMHYDYILKFETLDRDQNFFIQDANLSGYLYEKNYPRNINPRRTTKEVLDEYVKKLPRTLLDEIYKIYENDFKLFNYSLL